MTGNRRQPPSSPSGGDGRPPHIKRARVDPDDLSLPSPTSDRNPSPPAPSPTAKPTMHLDPSSASHFYIHSLCDTPASKINALLLRKCFEGNDVVAPVVKRLRSGDLLVQVLTPSHARNLAKIRLIHSYPVRIDVPYNLNTCQGVVSSEELELLTNDEIVELLGHEGVVRAYKLKKQDNRRQSAVLTFARPHVPDHIRVGWDSCKCRVYVPRPTRCFKCQRYGHTNKNCRSEAVCGRCSMHGHSQDGCNSTYIRCAACNGPHCTNDPSCETWLKESKISRVRAEERLSYWDAKKKVEDTTAVTPVQGVSYRSAAAASLPASSTPRPATCHCPCNCLAKATQPPVSSSPATVPQTSPSTPVLPDASTDTQPASPVPKPPSLHDPPPPAVNALAVSSPVADLSPSSSPRSDDASSSSAGSSDVDMDDSTQDSDSSMDLQGSQEVDSPQEASYCEATKADTKPPRDSVSKDNLITLSSTSSYKGHLPEDGQTTSPHNGGTRKGKSPRSKNKKKNAALHST